MPFPFPTIKEQEAIANYLDSATSKIDEAIAQQQKMIELLNERKQIIINNAVTKGLDPNVKMKPSGIDWIGDIPEHWKVMKTLFALSMPITDGPHETPQLYDDGIPFVSAEAVSCGNGKIDFDHIRGFISKAYYEECCKKYIPRRNDIYMIKSGATTGKVALVDTDRVFTIWSPLAVFRCNDKVMEFNYLFYLLQADSYQMQVQLGWSYGTQQNIGMRTLEKLKIQVPSLEEQRSIANFLNERISKIEVAKQNVNRVISLLQERKQIIINDVVTGKVKVV
jgi:type I restriction enzyme S subunit